MLNLPNGKISGSEISSVFTKPLSFGAKWLPSRQGSLSWCFGILIAPTDKWVASNAGISGLRLSSFS